MPDESVAPTTGVFGIGVVANLTGTGVQNLRAYEKAGLVHPQRTDGGTRLYSSADVARLQRITLLLDAGLNLAGIAMVMDLQDENSQLRAEKEEQQWLSTASIPVSKSLKPTSSNSSGRSTRR